VSTGEVYFGYLHFAFLGEESLWAAAASECAAEQDKFWEYHDYLFEKWSGENQGAFTQENLKQFAADLELDTVKFSECVDSGRMEGIVQQDIDFARQLGVSSTPTFAVNGKPVQGALPFSRFQQLIEQELTK
jgi:protein-disulfide isomerase